MMLNTEVQTITIGCLQNCKGCNRRRQEPGADYCPDCTLIVKLRENAKIARDLEYLFIDPEEPVGSALARDPLFGKFDSQADLLAAYQCWRKQNSWEAAHARSSICPCCGQEIDD